MAKSFYLVNPRSAQPSYFGAEVYAHWGLPSTQGIADLATTTVAAMAPDDWDVTICEEFVETVDFDTDVDYVGITGKITQVSRMIEVAQEFRRRGKTVIIGGPFASLSPDVVRPHCDVLVIGEMEDIADDFFADLDRGEPKREYVGERPDIGSSPPPRWDLYPNDRTRTGCIQTSRGCPFECEFCDVIQYLGRKQRHKAVEHIIAELNALHELGYRQVFLADDNFTATRKRARAILAALRDWNLEHADTPISFATQLSIDIAKDAEMMQLLAEAGMVWVFIGLETPNVESLAETKKRQNLGVDLKEQIQVFLDHGIQVTGGMIVGFDHDGPDIFQVQHDFAMATPVPIFSLGPLVAPAATPLRERIEKAGRLIEGGPEIAASPIDTNIVPTRMSKEELQRGLTWLTNSLYSPANFAKRVVAMTERMGPQRGPFRAELARPRAGRAVEGEAMALFKKLIRRGPEERAMWATILEAMQKRPASEPMVMAALYGYSQVRCLLDAGGVWDPHVVDGAAPAATLNIAAAGGAAEAAAGA